MEIGEYIYALIALAVAFALTGSTCLYYVVVRHRLLAKLRHISANKENRKCHELATALNMISGVEKYGKAIKKALVTDEEYLQEPLRVNDAGMQLKTISHFIKGKVKPKADAAIDGALIGILRVGAGDSISQTVVQFVNEEFQIDVTLKAGRAFAQLGLPSWYENAQGVVPKLMDILAGKSTATVREVIAESLERLKEDFSQIVDVIVPALAELARDAHASAGAGELPFGSPLSSDTEVPSLVSLISYPANAPSSLGRIIDTADDHARASLSYVDDVAMAVGDDAALGAASGLADDLIVASADDVAANVLGAGMAGIPVLTFIASSIREIRFLSNEKTDLDTALGNILLDAAGTGGGGLAGAVIGNMIVPGVGAVVGGIIGGLGGRGVTNKIKRADLEKAMESYKYAFRRATNAQNEAAGKFHGKLCGAVLEARKARREIIDRSPKVSHWDKAITLAAAGLLVSLHDKIDAAIRDLNSAKKEAVAAASRLGLPVKTNLIAAVAAAEKKARHKLENFRSQLPDLKTVEKRPEAFLHWFAGQAWMPVVDHGATHRTATAVASIVEVQTALLITWARMLAGKERQGMFHTVKVANAGAKKFRKDVESYVREVKDAKSRVKIEMDRLGIKHK